jgi:outer membrane protein TolC
MAVPISFIPANLWERLRRCVLIFGLVLGGGISSGFAKDYTVAIVRDGDSLYFDAVIEQFKAELTALSEGDRELVFKDSYNAAYDSVLVDSYLQQVLDDGSVDVVYAGGVMATEHALTRAIKGLSKPVVGGALQLSDIGQSFLSENGTSILENYTFIASPRRVFADLELLAQQTGASQVHVVIDSVYMPVLQERLELGERQLSKNLGFAVEFVLVDHSAESALAELPESTEAVYVTTLPRMTIDELEALYAGLIQRQLPSLAMSGRRGVERGALFGLAPDNTRSVARRAALNIHFIALGQHLDQLPVYLPLEDHFVINAGTAREIGWSPDYDTSLVAEFVNRDFRETGEPMDVRRAMLLAEERNVDVSIARQEQSLSDSDIVIARSSLRPQVNAIGNGKYTRNHDRINPSSTPMHSEQASVGLQLKKILFNDELRTNLKTKKRLAEAARYDTVSSELDAVEAASLSYFNCLRSQTLYEIERDNLRLTDNHYQLAKLRVDIGSADTSEIYRWEQARSQGRANLLRRESERKDALIAFNRILGVARGTQWSFEDVELGEREMYFMDAELEPLIQRAGTFLKLGPFLKDFAIDNSPELMAFDLQIAAQGLLLEQKKRRYYLPEVALTTDVTHFNKGSATAASDSESQVAAALSFTFPIFEGGRRREEILRQTTTIRLLNAQREKAVQQIEEFCLNSFNGILSAHPNIRLSRRALKSAEKNYDSVKEKYSQGAATILDLLDAQQTLLSQRQTAAIAVYDYLSTIHQLQRSIAWFEFKQSLEAKQNWIELFEKSLKENP